MPSVLNGTLHDIMKSQTKHAKADHRVTHSPCTFFWGWNVTRSYFSAACQTQCGAGREARRENCCHLSIALTFFWLTRWQPRVSKWDQMGGFGWMLAVTTDMESKDLLTTSAVDSKWKLVYWWSFESWWTHSGEAISVVTTCIKTYNAICETEIEVTT